MSAMRKYGIRFAMLGLLAAAFMAAPSAFARSHWSVGVNIGGPGWGVGYSDCRHCGWGGNYGYVGGGYYSGGYYPAYYAAPVYYGSYYPAYYPAASVYYYDRPSYYRHHRGYRHDGYYRHNSGYRSGYYDRGYRD